MDTASHNITVTLNEAPSLQTDFRGELGDRKKEQRENSIRTTQERSAKKAARGQQEKAQPKPGTNFLSYPLHRTLFAPTFSLLQSFLQ